MTDCPWPGGPLLNCRKHFGWLRDNGLVEGESYETCSLTELGSGLFSHSDTMLVFKSLNARKHYAKQFVQGRSGPEQVDSKFPWKHEVHLAWVRTIDDIHTVIRALQGHIQFCVVRGGLVPRARLHNVNRAQYNKQTPDLSQGVFDAAKRWLCIDLDDLRYQVPEGAIGALQGIKRLQSTTARGPLAAAKELLDQIAPDEFRRVESVVQLSASTGLKPNPPGVKCGIHWWLLLDRPATCDWLREVYAQALLIETRAFRPDVKLFSSNQTHYVAAPVLPEGTEDIERLTRLALPDHAALVLGLPERPLSASVQVKYFQFSEHTGLSGKGGMTPERKSHLEGLITKGIQFYDPIMALAKSLLWKDKSLEYVERYIMGLLTRAPNNERAHDRDERIRDLPKELRRLNGQVLKTRGARR